MATKKENRGKKVERYLTLGATGIMLVGLWAVLVLPEAALAEKPVKPDPVVLWDVTFASDGDFESDIIGSAFEVAQSNYRTQCGTGNVTVKLEDGTVLDQKPFLMRFMNDTTGERYLVFRIGLQGGHPKQDRYSTPTLDEGIEEPDMKPIPFPEKTEPSDGSPWLEVKSGSVDENMDMLPGAHVILHLHVSDVPLINMTGPNAGHVIGTISIGDIEFTLPE